jgi:hypothetical protein
MLSNALCQVMQEAHQLLHSIGGQAIQPLLELHRKRTLQQHLLKKKWQQHSPALTGGLALDCQ